MKEIYIKGFQKGTYLCFNGAIALYFMYSFFFPEQSDYWLVRNGFPIILIEFFCFFIIAFISGFWEERQDQLRGKSGHPLLGLAAMLAMTGIIIVVFNPLLFFYLLISVGIKFVTFRSQTNRIQIGNMQVYSMVFLILAVFAALILSNVMLSFTPQIIAYRDFFQTFPGTLTGLAVDNPGFIAVWGSLYFVFLSVYEIVVLLRSSRKKRKMIR